MIKTEEIVARIFTSLHTEARPVCVDGEPNAQTVWIKTDNHSFCLDGYQSTQEGVDKMRLTLGKALLALIEKYR